MPRMAMVDRGLQDFSDRELRLELRDRRFARQHGACDFCFRKVETLACKRPDRHFKKPGIKDRIWGRMAELFRRLHGVS